MTDRPASPAHSSTPSPNPGPWRRCVDFLISSRSYLLVASIVAALAALGPSLNLTLDRSIEALFPPDDPHLIQYREGEAAFGGSENAFVAYRDPDLMTPDGLARLERLHEQLEKVPGLAKVFSLKQVKLPGALIERRSLREHVIARDVPKDVLRDTLISSELYRGRLISPDGSTTVLVVTFERSTQATTRTETIRRIREICEQHQPRAVVAGGPVMVDAIYEHMEQDGRSLGLASSLVLASVIAILFRNLRWILLPLGVVHIALTWTKSLLVLGGVRLSMVSSPLVALVTVIGTATVVHVAIRFREERAENSPLHALRNTLLYIGPAIFWTCLTTALGFASLMVSRVAPVSSFGGMMTAGSMLVFVSSAMLLPGGVLLGAIGTDPGAAPGERYLEILLNRVITAVERTPLRLALGVATLVGIASLGMFQLEVATEFDENFRKSSEIVRSYRFIVDNMKTTRTIDLLFDAPKMNSQELDTFLQRVREVQEDLSTQEGVVGTLSLVNVLDFMAAPGNDRIGITNRVATLSIRQLSAAQRLALLRLVQPDVIEGFWNEDRDVMRLVVQVGDIRGADVKLKMVDAIESRAERHLPNPRAAGVAVLFIYLVKTLLADQWLTFSLAAASILVMLCIALRNWKYAVISLIPNAAPIVLVIGAMGWFDIQVNVATAMLASVSMGLSVDFSIHYLRRFQQELREGHDLASALRHAHGSVGLAMMLANVALIAGFSTLVLSAFIPTVQFGILVSVAMLGGLLGNLTVLPLLLRVLHAKELAAPNNKPESA